MSSLRSGSGRWQWRRVRRVEGLHPSLVIAVERRHRAVRSKAEVVASRVGEPGTDLIQIDAHPVSVDQRRRERLRHDQPEGVVGHAVVVGCEVADVLGGAKWGARLLDQEHGECGVGGQTRGLHVENVEAAEVGGQPDGDVDPRVRHTRRELRRGRRQVQLYDLGLAGRLLAAAVLSWASVLSWLGCYAVGSRYPSRDADRDRTATRNLCLDILRLLSTLVDGAGRSWAGWLRLYAPTSQCFFAARARCRGSPRSDREN